LASLRVENEGIEIAQIALEILNEPGYLNLDNSIQWGAEDIVESYSMPMAKNIWSLVYEGTWVQERIEKTFYTSAIDTWRQVRTARSFVTSQKPKVGGIMCYGNDSGGRAEIVLAIENDGFTVLTMRVENENIRRFSLGSRNLADGPSRRYVRQVYLGTILPPLHVNDYQ